MDLGNKHETAKERWGRIDLANSVQLFTKLWTTRKFAVSLIEGRKV